MLHHPRVVATQIRMVWPLKFVECSLLRRRVSSKLISIRLVTDGECSLLPLCFIRKTNSVVLAPVGTYLLTECFNLFALLAGPVILAGMCIIPLVMVDSFLSS